MWVGCSRTTIPPYGTHFHWAVPSANKDIVITHHFDKVVQGILSPHFLIFKMLMFEKFTCLTQRL